MTAIFADLQDDFAKVDGYADWKREAPKMAGVLSAVGAGGQL